MLNRRNFFKTLSSAIVGIYTACQVKLPEIDLLSNKVTYIIEEINLAWEHAPYEVAFYYGTECKKNIPIKLNKEFEMVPMMKYKVNSTVLDKAFDE